MSDTPDNPFAFPVPYETQGMTLRDWFAGQAVTGLVLSNVRDCATGDNAAERYAEDAYCIADAMLAARFVPEVPTTQPTACPQCGGSEYPCDDCIPF